MAERARPARTRQRRRHAIWLDDATHGALLETKRAFEARVGAPVRWGQLLLYLSGLAAGVVDAPVRESTP